MSAQSVAVARLTAEDVAKIAEDVQRAIMAYTPALMYSDGTMAIHVSPRRGGGFEITIQPRLR